MDSFLSFYLVLCQEDQGETLDGFGLSLQINVHAVDKPGRRVYLVASWLEAIVFHLHT